LYAPEVIKKYKIKAIIGKGGMDKKTLQAMKKYGCVYLAAVGGTGALIALTIKKVKNIYKQDFGMPEAIYELEIEKMPLIVAMDAKGNSIYEDVLKDSKDAMTKLLTKQ
jgi:tartrate/fumarate subfamily iron-sulfur-dependent hydro-lyase beta chain